MTRTDTKLQLRRNMGRLRRAVNFALNRERFKSVFTIFDEDVFLVSYPKSGNTWTRFLVANLLTGCKGVSFSTMQGIVPDVYLTDDVRLRRMKPPRVIKSHEPYNPAYRNVVLIVRDPRDVAISYYYHLKRTRVINDECSLESYLQLFLDGHFDAYGSWGENVGSWIGARSGSKGFLLVRYEDLVSDTAKELSRIAHFLSLSRTSNDIDRAVEESRIDKMRELERKGSYSVAAIRTHRKDIPFVRSGVAGAWMHELSESETNSINTKWHNVMSTLGYIA